jgi:V/A-type H+-transporting ATPase subunit I
MKKVSLIVHQVYLDDVLKSLHEAGIVQIIDISKDEQLLEESEQIEMHPDADICNGYESKLSRLIEILNKTKKKPKGMKAMLHPEMPKIRTVEEHTLDELYSYAESILSEIEKDILAHDERLNFLKERNETIDTDLEQVSYLKDFKLDISDIGESEYMFVLAGITSELDPLEKEIESFESVNLYSKQFGKGKEKKWAVIIASHKSEQEKIEKISREKITMFDVQHLSGSPNDIIKTLNKEKSEIKKEKKQIISTLRNYAKENLQDILVLREEIQLERARRETTKNFSKTNSTYMIEGWALEKNEDELKTLVTTASQGYVVYNSKTPSLNPDNPPTHLEIPKWAAPFKTLLDLFATPKYNEINPTVIMGIFFVLFFGVMLGDAGYGLLITILSLVGYLKFGKHSGMIKNWAFLGILLGLMTTIVGFLTNSFFGDLIPSYIYPLFYENPSTTLYSLTLGSIHLPIEPLRNPLDILVLSLLFGLIHLNVGILLAIYQTFKNKNYKSLILEHLSWVLLEVGGGALIGYFLLDMWNLTSFGLYSSAALVIIGLILRLKHAGPLGFFDITGFVGDWLSYARLLALGLATAGMALAFNIISDLFGSMIPIEIVGVIIMVFLLVLLHVINLGLQALGAGVHSLRLQYVEFFNRFYEGGGHEFKPFSIKRKHTKTEE